MFFVDCDPKWRRELAFRDASRYRDTIIIGDMPSIPSSVNNLGNKLLIGL